MRTLERKDLDWIERAPVSFSGSATTTASPEAVNRRFVLRSFFGSVHTAPARILRCRQC